MVQQGASASSTTSSRIPRAACEACRRLKMRCVRPEPHGGDLLEPCERCARNNRPCSIPEPRALGRKHGAKGKFRGVEKAFRQIESELRKVRGRSEVSDTIDAFTLIAGSESGSQRGALLEELLATRKQGSDGARRQGSAFQEPMEEMSTPSTRVAFIKNDLSEHPRHLAIPQQRQASPNPGRGTISNPLGLLADASEAAQAQDQSALMASIMDPPSIVEYGNSPSSSSSSSSNLNLSRSLLTDASCVSLGLSLNFEDLESGLNALFTPAGQSSQFLSYFKVPDTLPQRDTGPDVDPVDLGLISMAEVYELFPIYFSRLHPFNGILDPDLHTPEFVRARSALLFTWILAASAQFSSAHGGLVKRLRLHGEKLSRHVHTCGFKSVEIVQGYYISLLWSAPAKSIAEERTWIYIAHAFSLAAELGLDRRCRNPSVNSGTASNFPSPLSSPQIGSSSLPTSKSWPASDQPRHDLTKQDSRDAWHVQRLARNRERTWLRILLWERANGAALGRVNTFPENELTSQIDSWWQHPLSIATDKYTTAFVLLRRHLANLHSEIKGQAGLHHASPHWVRELIDNTLDLWCCMWLPSSDTPSPACNLSDVFLRYVYMHGRLLTLSFALHGSLGVSNDVNAIKYDCFEAAVHCSEIAVRDLREIGEPLYSLLSTSWAMMAYAAVLATKLFPFVHGSQPISQAQLVALLAQLALQLERAGTTPAHRFGTAALLSQHLLIILRARAAKMTDSILKIGTGSGDQQSPDPMSVNLSISHHKNLEIPLFLPFFASMGPPDPQAAPSATGESLMDDGFADILQQLFGQSYGTMA